MEDLDLLSLYNMEHRPEYITDNGVIDYQGTVGFVILDYWA